MIHTSKYTSLIVLAAAISLLTACGNKSKEPVPEEGAAAESAAVEQADAPELPKIDYIGMVIPAFAGTYERNCERIGVEAGAAGSPKWPLVIAADGKVTGPGTAHDIKSGMELTLIRQQDAKGVATLAATFHNDQFMLSTMEDDQGAKALFGNEKNQTQCVNSKPPGFHRESLAVRFSKVLDMKTRIKCMNMPGMDFVVVDYELAGGVVKTAGEVLDLRKMTMETINLGDSETFSVGGALPDDTQVLIMLDAQGKLDHFNLTRLKGKSLACEANHE